MKIRYVHAGDREFWYTLDKHLPEAEFLNKIASRSAYVICVSDRPVGLLRFSLFWDEIPFMNMLYIAEAFRKRGFGRMLVEFWENDMQKRGFSRVLTSTQSNEDAQHFYRKLGYRDCGGFIVSKGDPLELMLVKELA